jgi:monoamine oxidase
MQSVYDSWIEQSAVVTNPWAPWEAQNAAELDVESLGEQIPPTPADVAAAIATELELNNTIPVDGQSWLANLAQLQAGGGQGFFDDTEVFRCTAGNQQLAVQLLGELPLVPQFVTAIDTTPAEGVTITFADGQTAGPFDYVIVAVSVAMWPSIQVDGGGFPYPDLAHGPAIKYLAPVETRFWIQRLLAPSGMFDLLGMTWEGTDNQADTAGFDLTVFAGGRAAQDAIDNGGSDTYFAKLISELYPGFPPTHGHFENSSGDPTIQTGYSCPGRGQVVGAQQSYVTPHDGRLFLAGEHTSPAWFGFMEGALQSGIVAAARMARLAGVDLRDEWGGTTAL